MSDDSYLVSPAIIHASQARRSKRTHRLGVLASGSGSNFEAIAQAISDDQIAAEIALMVCNNPGAKAFDRAEEFSIPTQCIDHREFSNRKDFDGAVASELEAAGIDLVVMAGWMRLASEPLFEAFEGRMLNIHPSLLPSFPGLYAVEQAIEAGVKISGCTVHYVTREMDAGPIIIQAGVPVLDDDDADALHRRIQRQEHRIYPQAVRIALSTIGPK